MFFLVFEASFELSELILLKIVKITFDDSHEMQLLLLKFYRISGNFPDSGKLLISGASFGLFSVIFGSNSCTFISLQVLKETLSLLVFTGSCFLAQLSE